MENPAIILWIPLILISLASVVKLLNRKSASGKTWFRIEDVEDNE
jgi:hypothetical protein